MIDPIPKSLANGEYTFQYPDGTLWSELYGDDYVFKDARIFVEGMAKVKLKNGTITFVNLERKFLKLPMFTKILDARDFSEGYAAIETKEGCTYIDKNGNYIKGAPMFDRAYSFREGYARVQLKNESWTFINKNGDLMEHRFIDINSFNEGYAYVWLLKGGRTFVDTKGVLMKVRFYDLFSHGTFRNGLATVTGDLIKTKTMDKYENFWDEYSVKKLRQFYDNPEKLFDFDKMDKKFFRTALSVIKQKLIDMRKENSKEEVDNYESNLSNKIIEKYGDLVAELKQDQEKQKIQDKEV